MTKMNTTDVNSDSLTISQGISPKMPVLRCKKCQKLICSSIDLCFYNQNPASIHLSLKIERINSANEFFTTITEHNRNKYIASIICCKQCNEPVGNESLIGPKKLGVFCFSSMKVEFYFEDTKFAEIFSRKDWSSFQSKYSKWIEKRTFENFYPTSYSFSSDATSSEVIFMQNDEDYPLIYPTIEYMQSINPNSLSKSNPRLYQIELLLAATLSNTIVYLPTGCGKTLVAAMLFSVMKKLNPHRLCVFLVSKVPLAYQQSSYLAHETCLNSVVLCGESKQEIYFNDIYSYDIVVFTAQVFLNYLANGKIALSRISCIVLDEVHHAVGSSPLALFFDYYYDHFQDYQKPLIMGLTASPFEMDADKQKSLNRLNELCTHVWSDLYCPIIFYKDMVDNCSAPNVQYFLVEIDPTEALFECKFQEYIFRVFKKYYSHFGIVSNSVINEWSNVQLIRQYVSTLEDQPNLNDEQLQLINHIKQIYFSMEALEVVGYVEAYDCLSEIIKSMKLHFKKPWSTEDITLLDDLNIQLKATNKDFSNRFRALIEILTDDNVKQDSKMIIFVKARKTARWLTKRLKENKLINAQWNPEFIVGQSGDIDGMTWKEHQKPIINNFYKGITRLIIATNVIQEGIDVPSCDCVIHFDIVENVTQLIQSRGRARFKSSDFILICAKNQRDISCSIFEMEFKTKRLVEAYLLENFQRQDKNEVLAFISCLSQMVYSAKHLPASKKTFIPHRLVHKSQLSKNMKMHFLNIRPQQLSAMLNFVEANLVVKSISEPSEEQLFYGMMSFEVDCLIPDVDEKSISHVFLKIFDSIHESDDNFEFFLRRKASMHSLAVDNVGFGCFGIEFGSLLSQKHFVSFYQWTKEATLTISFTGRVIRIFFMHNFLSMIEIPFESLDSFIEIFINDGIMNIVIPISKSPYLYEAPIPKSLASRMPPIKELIDEYSGFEWKRTSWLNSLPSDLFEKCFCFNFCLYLDEQTKLNIVNDLSLFEKIGISVLHSHSLQMTKSLPSEFGSKFVGIRQKFGIDVAFKFASFVTTCSPFIFGQLANNDYLWNKLDSYSCVELESLSNHLLQFYIIPSNRFYPIQQVIENFSPASEASSFSPLNSCCVKFVTITPTRIICNEPKLMYSNRILRKYGSKDFVRVHFREENNRKISVGLSLFPMGRVFEKFSKLIKNGIFLCGSKFEFLAMSSSQLRNHGCWFYNPTETLPTVNIRNWLGDFSQIRNVAKYVARLGQSLSASVEYHSGENNDLQFEQIPDVLKYLPSSQNPSIDIEYNFTDGIGCIAPEMMKTVASNFGLSCIPSAIQIRIGGFKGVVAVYPKINELGNAPLLLRPSMCKFASPHKRLDILNFSEYIPCYLNKQIIMIMTAIGVSDDAIEDLQNNMLLSMINQLVEEKEYLSYLSSNYKCPYFTSEELSFDRSQSNINYSTEPFFRSLIISSHKAQLNDLLNKSRIYVPKGRILMGVVDESGMLAEDEVFVQCSIDARDCHNNFFSFPTSNVDGQSRFVVTGKVTIAKNPCMHPGDIRVLNAVNNSFLSTFMCDVVVFPRTGTIPIPTMCSGSDLDGDLYFVTWDSHLIPTVQEEPLPYLELAQQAISQQSPVSIDQVADFMINFIQNDQLGVIANSHVAHSDQKELGVRDPLCKQLACLFSMAVDFPKTGFVATMPEDAKVNCYPDFMQKFHLPSYESSKVVGKMYRKVREIVKISPLSTSQPVGIDEDYLIDGFEDYLDSASHSFLSYESQLRDILRRYGISSESQILSNCLLQNDMIGSEDKKDVLKLAAVLVQDLRIKTRRSFFHNLVPENALKKASAWYYVAYNQKSAIPILSFPWLVEDILMNVKKVKDNFSLSELFSVRLLESFSLFNSKYSLAHHLMERFELFKKIESVVLQVDRKLHCKLYGSSVFLMLDLISDLNILIDGFDPDIHKEKLIDELKKAFSNQIQVLNSNSDNADSLLIKGQGSIYEFCITFEGHGNYMNSMEVLSFFNEFPAIVPMFHFIIRICRSMGILKKISTTLLCVSVIRCIYFVYPKMSLPSLCIFTVSFLTHLLTTIENSKSTEIITEKEDILFGTSRTSTGKLLFQVLSLLSDGKKMAQISPSFNPSLSDSFFSIYNLCAQCVNTDFMLENVKSTYENNSTTSSDIGNHCRLKLIMKGVHSGYFVAGSSRMLFEGCKSGRDLVHFNIYSGKKRPSHMDINCFVPSLSDTSNDANFVSTSSISDFYIDDKQTFADFYQIAFKQFTHLRDNYSVEKFGSRITARIKLGSVYVTNIPRTFIQEALSSTIDNIHLSLSRGYRNIDLSFEDVFAKSQAHYINYEEDEENCKSNEDKSDLSLIKKLIDEKSSSAQSEERQIRRKKSKRLASTNSSFESYAASLLPITMFLNKYKFELDNQKENTYVFFVAVPSVSNPKHLLHLSLIYDREMKFIEATYSPLKWLQLDVVSNKQLSNSILLSSKTDFRVNVTSLKSFDLDSLKSLIAEDYFNAIISGKVVEFRNDGDIFATELFRKYKEEFMCKKSSIKYFKPTKESQVLLQNEYPSLKRFFASDTWLHLGIKVVTTTEYSFPDINTGRFAFAIEKYEVEPRIELDESMISNSLFYEELIYILWSMGKFFTIIANE